MIIIEKITGKDLNTFLSDTFWKPIGLTHITYNPLQNGFQKDNIAATELNGNTRDLFIAPQSSSGINYGIGWWREADDKRVWYFGTQSPESTVGHQGWTGTLTMIDFENNMVIVFLTNSINTKLTDTSSLNTANDFSGKYYTTSTLGFVPQIIYTGLNSDSKDLKEALNSLINDMANEKKKDIESREEETGKKFDEEHAIIKAKKALDEVVNKRAK